MSAGILKFGSQAQAVSVWPSSTVSTFLPVFSVPSPDEDESPPPVSYTHLDVYKRQLVYNAVFFHDALVICICHHILEYTLKLLLCLFMCPCRLSLYLFKCLIDVYKRQLLDFVAFSQLISHSLALYVISVRRTRNLLTTSFRFHLTMDTLAVQLYTSHYLGVFGTFTR